MGRWCHPPTDNCLVLSGVSDYGLKWVRLATNGTNRGLFQIRFQYIFRRGAKCTEIWSEKVPDLSHLVPIRPIFSPNLTLLAARSITVVPRPVMTCLRFQPLCHCVGKQVILCLPFTADDRPAFHDKPSVSNPTCTSLYFVICLKCNKVYECVLIFLTLKCFFFFLHGNVCYE